MDGGLTDKDEWESLPFSASTAGWRVEDDIETVAERQQNKEKRGQRGARKDRGEGGQWGRNRKDQKMNRGDGRRERANILKLPTHTHTHIKL